MKKSILFAIVMAIAVTGCMPQTNTQKGGVYGAAGGAAAGAGLGQAIGRNTKSTLVGAAIGAAVGGLGGAGVGSMMDNQERDMRQAVAQSEAASIKREGDLLAISLKGDVTFDTNSSIVRPGLYSEIDRVSNVIKKYPDTVIMIEGHTDSKGSEAYNMDLSRRRADAVKDLFIDRGVAPSRLEIAAYGESKPVATNETESGRQLNRRVEIKIAPNAYGQQP